MTSNRRRKQQAQAKGLTDAELQLTELLGQVLDLLRWNQVLGYSNQYLLHEKLGVDEDELVENLFVQTLLRVRD